MSKNYPPEDQLVEEPTVVNMGPSHPAMHGNIFIKLWLNGERIQKSQVNIGYLHRGFEKECENHTWQQNFPYTDRLNYVSPMLNNVGYAVAVEKLLGIDVPERAQYLRVIVGEIARISDHLTSVAAQGMEMGAFTPYFYLMKGRDWLWDLIEEISGARVTHAYVRIGGVAYDAPPNFKANLLELLPKVEQIIQETEALLNGNRIFHDRMIDVGKISGEDAVSFGWTGPCLRGSGVDYDVRKAHPYLVYDRMDFEVPVGTNGDNMDRYLVRIEEMRQSMRIIEQALDQMQEGPVVVDDPQVVMPRKAETYNSIEGMINHFKLVIDGVKPPAGEIYSYTEAGNGELGFYLVSDGTGQPVKCRCRPPCFYGMTALSHVIDGHLLADIIPTFDTFNMIGGECDR